MNGRRESWEPWGWRREVRVERKARARPHRALKALAGFGYYIEKNDRLSMALIGNDVIHFLFENQTDF